MKSRISSLRKNIASNSTGVHTPVHRPDPLHNAIGLTWLEARRVHSLNDLSGPDWQSGLILRDRDVPHTWALPRLSRCRKMIRANKQDEMPNSRTGELIGSVWVTLKVGFLHTTAYNAIHLLKRPKAKYPK